MKVSAFFSLFFLFLLYLFHALLVHAMELGPLNAFVVILLCIECMNDGHANS